MERVKDLVDTVIKNNTYTMNITGMTHEGQGVGRVNNFTVFVEGAIQGETVDVRIIKVTKSYAVGKLLNIIKTDEKRTNSFCSAYARCGGCSLQHMSYEGQLEFKTNTVKESIKRIGKLEGVKVHDAIGMDTSLGYRNKAQYPVGMSGDELTIGFYAKRSHDIIQSESCGIQHPVSDKIREIVSGFLSDNNITAYDEKIGSGLVRHVMTRIGFKSGEVMVVVVINGKDLPKRDQLIETLTLQVPQITSIVLNVNTKKTNVILGDKNITIFGSGTISDYIGRYKFEISPLSFFQVNPVQTEVLYSKALEYAGLTGKENVFDLYCGIGTISLFLSEKAKKVYGVEVVEEAVRDARRNAELNNVSNAEFMVGEAEKVIPEVYSSGVKADVVVVDPPRKGCDQALLETLVSMQPNRIVYVSCNPATLARDLSFLTGNGFKVIEVQPVDMFPWTPHVECVIGMQRKDT